MKKIKLVDILFYSVIIIVISFGVFMCTHSESKEESLIKVHNMSSKND